VAGDVDELRSVGEEEARRGGGEAIRTDVEDESEADTVARRMRSLAKKRAGRLRGELGRV
jgi:hypothetical protein